MYNDTSKHLYDITILSDNERIKKFLKNKKEQLRMIKYKREEEERRYGGIDKNGSPRLSGVPFLYYLLIYIIKS